MSYYPNCCVTTCNPCAPICPQPYCGTGTTGCCQPCNPCNWCDCSRCRPKCHKKKKHHKKCGKCYRYDCRCIEYYPCLKVKCGCISANLAKSANPTSYTGAGQSITYSYTITNTGTAVICDPIQICAHKLGGWQIPCSYIAPCSSQTFTRVYTTTDADTTAGSITNTAVAYIQVKKCKYVCTPQASTTITYGSADVSGTLSQVLAAGGTGADVTVTISNSASSASSAYNVVLDLPLPANAGTVVAGALPPTSISGTNVNMTIPTLAAGATQTYNFIYSPTVTTSGTSYQWAGTITSSSYDPNTSNNAVGSTFTFP